jgi:hypothetical protein
MANKNDRTQDFRGQINRQYEDMQRRRNEQMSKKHHARLLPDDLAEQIIENGKKELKRLEKEIKRQEKALEKKMQERAEHRRLSWELREEVPQYKRVYAGHDEGYKMVEIEPKRVTTEESKEHAKKFQQYSRMMPLWENYINKLKSQYKQTEEVIKEAHLGIYTTLVKIVESWENKVVLAYGVRRLVEDKDTGVYSDAAGYPTPDGQPIWAGIPRRPPQ